MEKIRAILHPIIDVLEMDDGEIKVKIYNSCVQRVIPTYENLRNKIPKALSNAEFEEIKKPIFEVKESFDMKFGEFRIIVVSHYIVDVKPSFDYWDKTTPLPKK